MRRSLIPVLLASYFVLGPCSDGRSGFVLVLHAMGISVTAAYCHA